MYTDPAFPGGQHPMRRRPGLGVIRTGGNIWLPGVTASPLPGAGFMAVEGGGVLTSSPFPEPAVYVPPLEPTAPGYQPTVPTTPTQPAVQPSAPVVDTTPIAGTGWGDQLLWGQPVPVEGQGTEFSSGPTDVTVSVAGQETDDEGHGFGIVEAGLGVLLAFLLGKAWQDRRR